MRPVWFVGIFLTILLGAVGFMLADNQQPYIYLAEKSYVRPDPAAPGHQILVHWEFKVNRVCPGLIVRTLVDARTGAKISYDPILALGTIKMGDTSLERTFLLPEGMLPGHKIYRANAEYVCNPLHRIWPLKVQTPDIHFEVKSE